jgi:hypothetical protein
MTPKQLRELGDNLFAKRAPLMSLWQEIAEQFYPERADFTLTRTGGEDFAAHLSTSYPILCRRELGDQTGMMLRPTNKPWMRMAPTDVRIEDNASRRWLEYAENAQRRAMYDPVALFTKAARQADHDFSTFGNCVESAQMNRFRSALLYQTWHLRDVAWRENQDGVIDFVARKMKMALVDVIAYFPKADLDPKIRQKVTREPFLEIELMHIVCTAELWDGNPRGKPRISIYYDCTHNRPIEEIAIWGRIYRISRWATFTGSQYGMSPAVVAALPEARLLQAMTLTLLEAGEKAVNPPLIATKDAVKSDMQQFPGGVTWVDMEYDERLGEALRAMNIDVKGLPITLDMVKDSRGVLQQCFFLNKLRAFNPGSDPQMTAFQAGQVVQEYIRGALPLFEPMEQERNGQICEESFEVLYRHGAFGSPFDIPAPLKNANVEFKFESPLHDAIESQKSMKFLEFKEIVAAAVALDPAVAHIPDAKVMVRDIANGIRVPAKWLHTEGEVKDAEDQAAAARQQQALLANITTAAGAAKDLGAARKDLAAAEPQ